MTTPRLNAGDRIRLTVLDVSLTDGQSIRVTLKYAWPKEGLTHSCIAEVCDTCTTTAANIARRRLNTDADAASFLRLRDGQSTAR